jgi:uncharacterized membrane protein
VVVIVVARMAAAGRLPRNLFAGIRIPSTMRSDAAWRAGHRAAAPALTVAGLGPVLAAVAAAVTTAKQPGLDAGKTLLRAGDGWLLGWLGLAILQASRAARATGAG